jgi:hypothetical protein
MFPGEKFELDTDTGNCAEGSISHIIPEKLTGWWLPYPSEKYEFVSWDDEIPNFSWKVIQNSMVPVTTNQIDHPRVSQKCSYPSRLLATGVVGISRDDLVSWESSAKRDSFHSFHRRPRAKHQ